MKILVIAEHDNREIKSATYHALAAAKALHKESDILVMGHDCYSVAEKCASVPDVQSVLLANHEVYQHQLAENCAELIAKLAESYDYVLAGASTFAKNILPRAAALLDVAMLSDVTQILSADTFVRPIYAGNVLATVQTLDKIKIITIRTTSFPAINITAGEKSTAKIENTPAASRANARDPVLVNDTIINSLSRFESQRLTQSARPELTSARIVISGGRGLKSADNFRMLESLADRLGAAIGASRAAVDAGFAPNDYQVGQTGKVVAPDLYIAIGISGAIQHLAGMKDSKVIVAINNDPEAPILQIADYALVGDLFKILPELQQALDKVSAA